jgi:hypothetical protein
MVEILVQIGAICAAGIGGGAACGGVRILFLVLDSRLRGNDKSYGRTALQTTAE